MQLLEKLSLLLHENNDKMSILQKNICGFILAPPIY